MRMKELIKWMLFCGLVGMATSCALIEPRPNDPYYAPPPPPYDEPTASARGTILQLGNEPNFYEDIKARRQGDILTVIFDENMDANKEVASDASKNSTVTMPNPTLLGKMLNFDLPFINNTRDLSLTVDGTTGRDFTGAATSKQKNNLDGTMSVTVTRVMPNGNLLVKGEKWLTLNQGDEFIRLTGMVRSKDVSPDNVVFSSRIADGRISYSGVGQLADSNKAGWLYRALSSVFWPL